MSEELFSVWWWDPEGNYYPEKQWIPAKEAVELVAEMVKRPAAKLGVFATIRVVDGGDSTVFEWQHGKGIIR